MVSKFTFQMERVLIELWRSEKLLWDSKHHSHKDGVKRYQLFEKFSNYLSQKFNKQFTAVEVHSKLILLKLSFHREFKRLQKLFAAGVENTKPKWIHYNALTFLQGTILAKESVGPFGNVKEHNSNCVNFEENVEMPNIEPKYGNKTMHAVEIKEEPLDKTINPVETIQATNTEPLDKTINSVETVQATNTEPLDKTINPVETIQATNTEAIEETNPIETVSQQYKEFMDTFFHHLQKSVMLVPRNKRQEILNRLQRTVLESIYN